MKELLGAKYSFGRASIVGMHPLGRNNSGTATINPKGLAFGVRHVF